MPKLALRLLGAALLFVADQLPYILQGRAVMGPASPRTVG